MELRNYFWRVLFNNELIWPNYIWCVNTANVVPSNKSISTFDSFFFFFDSTWMFDNFCDIVTFLGFFGLVLMVIYTVVSEVIWMSQLFNARVSPVLKKHTDKSATYYFMYISENNKNTAYFCSIFLYYFY